MRLIIRTNVDEQIAKNLRVSHELEMRGEEGKWDTIEVIKVR